MVMRSRKGRILFVILQLMLYIAFLFLDFTHRNVTISSYIKFMVIIGCFCYALFVKESADKSILSIMKAAMFFTVISDLLILILDVYFYGVLTFIIVQQLYGLRISLEKYQDRGDVGNKRIWNSFIRRILLQLVISFLILSITTLAGVKPEPLMVVSIFYFINIVINTLTAIKMAVSYPASKNVRIFALGMLLFLLCDINVGLFNITGFIEMPWSMYSVLYEFSSILMWVFYAPAQVLLALSIQNARK